MAASRRAFSRGDVCHVARPGDAQAARQRPARLSGSSRSSGAGRPCPVRIARSMSAASPVGELSPSRKSVCPSTNQRPLPRGSAWKTPSRSVQSPPTTSGRSRASNTWRTHDAIAIDGPAHLVQHRPRRCRGRVACPGCGRPPLRRRVPQGAQQVRRPGARRARAPRPVRSRSNRVERRRRREEPLRSFSPDPARPAALAPPAKSRSTGFGRPRTRMDNRELPNEGRQTLTDCV